MSAQLQGTASSWGHVQEPSTACSGPSTAARERPGAFQDDRTCCGGRKNTLFCPCFSLRSALLCGRDKTNTFRNNPIVFTVLANTSFYGVSAVGKEMAMCRLELPREGS